MSLLPAVITKAVDPNTGPTHMCLLNFLIANAVGCQNAQPWSVIEAHLQANGHRLSQTTFQQGLLKESRETDFFIGSFDHGIRRGYFIIHTQADAELMRDWYDARISKELARLASLRRQVVLPFGWPI
jgi:hypothetical protein